MVHLTSGPKCHTCTMRRLWYARSYKCGGWLFVLDAWPSGLPEISESNLTSFNEVLFGLTLPGWILLFSTNIPIQHSHNVSVIPIATSREMLLSNCSPKGFCL